MTGLDLIRTTGKMSARRRVWIGGVTALIVGGCAGEATTSPTPSVSSTASSHGPTPVPALPAHGRIAFTLEFGPTGDDGNILTIEPNGTGLRMLTAVTAGRDGDPAWTATGDRIVFDSTFPPGASSANATSSNLFSMGSDGGSIRQLTSEPIHVFDGDPAVSPDGTRIAFDRFDLSGRQTGIYLVNTDGSHIVRITAPPASAAGGDQGPNFSPDGTKLAFVRDRVDGGDGVIYIVGVNGAGLRQVTPTSLNAAGAHWSPDGSKLLFGTPDTPSRGGRNVYVVNVDGSGVHALTSETGQSYAEAPRWSPDGTMIVFDQFQDGDYFVALVVMHADGSNPVVIWHPTPHADVFPTGPAWGTAR
jgi:Tol biopolymer transport system component